MTNSQKQLSRKYMTYRLFASLWFVEAVWLYFYRIFITDQQVGILDGMAFGIGLLAEVPSGALADKFGRDRLVRLGQILAGVGLLIQAAGSSFIPFFVGQAIMMIGVSFVSGADEALFFSNLKFDKKSTDWRKLITRGSQIGLVATFVAVVAGGWLHTINPRIPWILNGIAFIASAFIIWQIKDTRPKKGRGNFTEEIKDYLQEIKLGFSEFRLPKFWLYVPIILTVQGLFYTTGWGLLRLMLLDRFHFSPFWGSVALATINLITVIVLHYMHKHAVRLSEKKVISVISIGAIVALLASLASLGTWGYFVILALFVGENTLYPFMSETLNNRASEEQRATVLSVASFLKTAPYVLLGPIIGYLNTHGKLDYFLIGWSVLIGLAVIIYLSAKKRDTLITIEAE